MKRINISALLMTLLSMLCVSNAQAQSQQAAAATDCSEVPQLKERLNRVETYLKDWPNLGRYREENAQVSAPSKGETRVVFMGDSITDYWDNPGFGGFFPGKPYINRGISGQITPQMLIRFRPDVIAFRPKVVVILAGTNDIAGELGPTRLAAAKDNLSSMAEPARAHGIRVVLASILPVNDYKRTRDGKQLIRTSERPAERIHALNEWIKSYAESNGHTFLDYYTAVADIKGMLKEDLADDGVHPNSKGYAVMAPLVEKAIEKALKSR